MEEKTQLDFLVDTDEKPTEVIVPKVIEEPVEVVNTPSRPSLYEDTTISCLKNERVIVRRINKLGGLVTNPKHVLAGGMAETATRTFCVPVLQSSGAYKNILTDSEKDFLEQYLGLEKNALSIYKQGNKNFWNSSNKQGINTVTLGKQDTYLDLSEPSDYIKYKILLAWTDIIAPSQEVLEDHPKATYQYVLINEKDQTKTAGIKLSIKKQCYKELGKLNGDLDTLRTIVELITGKPTSPKVDEVFLETTADDLITTNSKLFLQTITDPYLSAKVLLKKAIEKGAIGKKGDGYYLLDGTPLCEMNENPTLNAAAKYLNSPAHQQVKFLIEAKTNKND